MSNISNPKIIDRWYGMKTDIESEALPDGYLANAVNVDCSSIGAIAASKGYTKFGNTSQTAERVISAPIEQYSLKDGSSVALKAIDDDSTVTILWLNTQKTTNNSEGEWEQLLASWATGKEVWFAPFNTTSENRLYISNGTQNLSYWNGATTYLTVATVGAEATITVADTTNFGATGTLTIGTTANVTYTGKTGTTFTGCSNVPAASINDGVSELPDTSTLSAAPKLENMKTVDARIVGSINTRLYFSAIADGTDWTVPSPVTLSSPGVRDFPEGDGNIESIDMIGDSWIIGKPNRTLSYKIQFTTSTLDPREIISEIDGDYGPVSDNFVKIDSNTLSYITSDGQVRLVQQNQLNDRLTATELNLDIRPTMENGVYTTCKGVFWRKERKLLYTFKVNSDSSQNDTQLKVEFVVDKEAGLSARPQLSVMNFPINCFSKNGNKLLGHGSYEKETFNMFDGYTKDDVPFTSIATTKRYPIVDGLREGTSLYLPILGYIASGQVLKFELDYDNNGSRAHLESTFDPLNNENDAKKIVQPNVKTIGAFQIGTEPIGGTIEEISELNFFRIIFSLPESHHPYNIQFTIYSQGVIKIDGETITTGSRWKVLMFALDRTEAMTKADKKFLKTFS